MFIIVGLGNPGKEYAHTRHNLGRMVLESVATEQGASLVRSLKHAGHISELRIAETPATILLPDTFMNKSGSAVKTLVVGADAPQKLVVVYDDIDLPLGTLRVAFARGSGGHNGVESIIKAMKTKEFLRIRIGCAPLDADGIMRKPKGEDAVVRFLMSDLGKKEISVYPDIVVRVREALALILTKGKTVAMHVVNTG